MKKTLLLFAVLLSIGALHAQTCERDSNLLVTGSLLSPAPYTPDSAYYNLAPACIGLAYNQSVTIYPPAEFSGFPITSVSVATTGAISALPAGLTYACDPPNCVFQPLTLGCILIYGTVDPSNTVDTVDLGITASVATAIITLPVQFPGQVAPGSHYYLPIRTAADCMSATDETFTAVAGVRNYPNPFTGITHIQLECRTSGQFQFQVLNLVGQRVYTQNVQLIEGDNQFSFDAGSLAPGTYFYSIGNNTGKVTRRMIID